MKQMTSRQRLLAAIEGQGVDTIPVSPRIWRYASWKKMTRLDLAAKFDYDAFIFGVGSLTNPLVDTYCKQTISLLPDVKIDIATERQDEKTILDRTFNTPGGPLHDVIVMPDPGGQYGISPNHEWLEPLLKTSDDIDLLNYLLPNPDLVRNNLADAQKIQDEVGHAGLVAYRPTTGVDQFAIDAFGVANAMLISVDHPDWLDRTLNIVDNWHTQVMKIVLEAGWKIIFDAWFNFSLSVGWSPRFHREKAVPIIKKHADLVHSYGGKLFFYDDGKQANSIGAVIDAGADIIQTLTPPPSGDLDFQALADTHGGRACFNGGIDTVKLRFGSPDEIERDVRERLDVMAPTGKFILGTSDSITEGTPEENMIAFFRTAREHGKTMAKRLYG